MRLIKALHDALWGWHILLLILAAGVYFTVSTRFFQIRKIRHWLSVSFSPARGEKNGGITHFQAIFAALGGSIGTGNIVGVAAAISVGGAGALFWMWLSSLFGMMTVFAENYLSAENRAAPGALGYIRKAGKPLAVLYAVGCCCSSLGMGNMAQTNACASAVGSFGVPKILTGVVLAAVVFFVARGGLKFAVKITDRLVPTMTLIFFAASLAVLWVFRENIPSAVKSVFSGAFSFRAEVGGTAGAMLAIKTGVARGVFTNEAGLGSAAFAYDEVSGKTSTELGCMGIFQVFIDTTVMCTVTGLCILCCRSPMLSGAELTFFAYQAALGRVGGVAVSLCTALFALATVVTWCCYGRTALFYLTHGRLGICYAILAAAAAFVGCVAPLGAVLDFGDAMNGLMAVPNLISLFMCRKAVRPVMTERYSMGKKTGDLKPAQNFQNI